MKVHDKYMFEIAEVIRGYANADSKANISEPLARINGFNTLVFDENGLKKVKDVTGLFDVLEAVWSCPAFLLEKEAALDKIMLAYKEIRT